MIKINKFQNLDDVSDYYLKYYNGEITRKQELV